MLATRAGRTAWFGTPAPPLAPVASGVLLAWASPAVDWAYLPPQPCLGAGVSVSGFPGLVGGPTGRPLLLLPVPRLLPPTPAPSGFPWLGLWRGLLPVSHQPGPLFCPLPPSPFLLPPLQSGTVSNVSKLGLLPPSFPTLRDRGPTSLKTCPTPKPSSHAPGTWPHLPSAQPCSASQVSLLHPRCSACAICKRPLAWDPPSSRVHRTESCLSFRAWLCFQAPEETGLDSGQNVLSPEPRGMRFPVLGKLKRGFSTENEVRTRPPLVNRVCSWHLGHKRCCPGPLQQWGRHA